MSLALPIAGVVSRAFDGNRFRHLVVVASLCSAEKFGRKDATWDSAFLLLGCKSPSIQLLPSYLLVKSRCLAAEVEILLYSEC
jgi:hypothetical protein